MIPAFLTMEDVLEIHRLQIERFGGAYGIRDEGLLKSAIEQPKAYFEDHFLYEDISAMAAAYMFHITRNHPFVDGNKRVGLHAALLFLFIHGIEILNCSEELYVLTMKVARGEINKETLRQELSCIVEKTVK